MKRYEHYGTLDGGGPAEAIEDADGEWVRHEDALAAVAAERERCARELRYALLLACERIADGPQEYHEANTANGWAEKFIQDAKGSANA